MLVQDVPITGCWCGGLDRFRCGDVRIGCGDCWLFEASASGSELGEWLEVNLAICRDGLKVRGYVVETMLNFVRGKVNGLI